MASFSNIYLFSCLTTILILVSIFFTEQIILYKNTRNGENGESGKNGQRVGENLKEISRNSPCKVTKVTKNGQSGEKFAMSLANIRIR